MEQVVSFVFLRSGRLRVLSGKCTIFQEVQRDVNDKGCETRKFHVFQVRARRLCDYPALHRLQSFQTQEARVVRGRPCDAGLKEMRVCRARDSQTQERCDIPLWRARIIYSFSVLRE